jgi:hypothetical protein
MTSKTRRTLTSLLHRYQAGKLSARGYYRRVASALYSAAKAQEAAHV